MKSGRSAGFWRRLAALVYDAVLVAALWMAYTGAALLLSHGRALLSEGVGFWVYPYRLGLVLVLAAYCILNWMRSGQTLGMRAWHLQAVDARGRRLRLQAAPRCVSCCRSRRGRRRRSACSGFTSTATTSRCTTGCRAPAWST